MPSTQLAPIATLLSVSIVPKPPISTTIEMRRRPLNDAFHHELSFPLIHEDIHSMLWKVKTFSAVLKVLDAALKEHGEENSCCDLPTKTQSLRSQAPTVAAVLKMGQIPIAEDSSQVFRAKFSDRHKERGAFLWQLPSS